MNDSPNPSLEQRTDARGGKYNLDMVRLLARKRRYEEAAVCLAEVLAAGGCSKAEALDLQARMYAQQGMLLQADSCWRQAAALDPGNHLYGKAIATVREQTNAGSRVWNLSLQTARLLLLVALVGLGIGMWKQAALRHYQTQMQLDAMRNRAEQFTSRVEATLENMYEQIHSLASAEMVIEASAQGNNSMTGMERRLLDHIKAQQAALAASIASNQRAIAEMVNSTAEQQKRLTTERLQESAAALSQLSNAVDGSTRLIAQHSARVDGQERQFRDLGAQMEQMRLAGIAHQDYLRGMTQSNEVALAEIRAAIARIDATLRRQAPCGPNGPAASGAK